MDTKKLRQKILDLAIRGKLVPQDPNDEPASLLLERIRTEKERLIKEGKIKRGKKTDEDNKIEAPFEIPDSWEWTTIGEIALSILYGVSESAKESGSYKLLRITDIQNNKVNWETVPFTNYDKEKVQPYLLQDGDILFARTGATVGKSYLVEGLLQPSIYASYLIRVQTSSVILPSYIKLFFESGYYWEQISLSSVGIGQPNVNGTTLAALSIPIPPYQEQQRISNEINRWFTLIDELESNEDDLLKAIDKAKSKILDLAIHGKLVPQDPNDEPAIELLKRINPKFNICDGEDDVPEGWEVASFKTICDTISSKPYQILQSEIKDSGKFPVISQSANYIEGYSDREECVLQVKNPVLIFGDHTRVLKYVDFDFIVGADGVKIIQTKLTPKYVYYVLLCTIHKIQGKGYARHFSILSNTLIPVPPREEQLRIVSKIEEVFKALDALS